jgi:hypothetical protein
MMRIADRYAVDMCVMFINNVLLALIACPQTWRSVIVQPWLGSGHRIVSMQVMLRDVNCW